MTALADTILSAKVGVNADIFCDIVRLYVPDSSLVVDLTFGLGRFWTKTMLENRTLIACDLDDRFPKTRPLFENVQYVRAKAPDLPFKKGSAGAVVFDPPYGNFSTKPRSGSLSESYALKTLLGLDALGILYTETLVSMWNLLEPKGIAIVKCQDAVNNGENHWIHMDLRTSAAQIGFKLIDLFVLVSENVVIDPRITRQIHARKSHSYFLVFRKI